jgi:hypothetical protein
VPGGRLDAVGAVAEVRDVEVPLEDLLLGVVLLVRDGELELPDLAGDRLLRGRPHLLLGGGLLHEGELDELLGDGRAALRLPVLGGRVVQERTQRALEVECAVLVEAAVLDGQQGVVHLRADLLQRDVLPVLLVEVREQAAVGREQARGLGRGSVLERERERDHVLADVVGGDGRERRHGHEHGRDDEAREGGQARDRPDDRAVVLGGTTRLHATTHGVGQVVPGHGPSVRDRLQKHHRSATLSRHRRRSGVVPKD